MKMSCSFGDGTHKRNGHTLPHKVFFLYIVEKISSIFLSILFPKYLVIEYMFGISTVRGGG